MLRGGTSEQKAKRHRKAKSSKNSGRYEPVQYNHYHACVKAHDYGFNLILRAIEGD